ncbi:MAG: T9SS type A sorting domain-containing protein, partial [Chitinophagaceae bacterium]
IEIKPYVYPIQDQTHITQCGTNSFAFKDSVTGGIAPFTYEILATVPNLPSLFTGTQSSNTFIIPPGAGLDTIKVRVMDACGNAHVKNFPVSHLVSCLPLDVASDPEKQNKPEGLITVFPNPSRNEFFVKFSKKKKSNYRIEVTNTIGITVYKKTVENIDFQAVTINNSLVPGIYFIHVTDMKTNKKEVWEHLVQ